VLLCGIVKLLDQQVVLVWVGCSVQCAAVQCAALLPVDREVHTQAKAAQQLVRAPCLPGHPCRQMPLTNSGKEHQQGRGRLGADPSVAVQEKAPSAAACTTQTA